MRKLILLMSVFFCIANSLTNKDVDVVIFSFDRDLQLDTFLSSMKYYAKGINRIFVIYRTSSDYLTEGYEQVKKRHSDVTFYKQLGNPPRDFKKLLINIFKDELGSQASYILFGVDDLIFIDHVHLKDCVDAIEKYHAYAFYLRLGLHFTWCGSAQKKQATPPHKFVNEDMFIWRFNEGEYEFAYPNDLSMALYRRSDAIRAVNNLIYNSPNQLEGGWASQANLFQNGLAYTLPKLFNLPINLVQQDGGTPNMNLYTPMQLSKLYHDGFIIDFQKFYQLKAESCQVNIVPTFKKFI